MNALSGSASNTDGFMVAVGMLDAIAVFSDPSNGLVLLDFIIRFLKG
jgi:hypothetical protein